MTINKYISDKFQKFGIQMSEADLLDICMGMNLNGCDELTNEVHAKVNVGIAKFIPELLLRATSISESGFSMSWDIKGIKEYYAYLCKKYGLKDLLSDKPKCTFL